MSYTLTFEHPDFPDEVEFGIQDLGRVKNHGTLEVDEDAERRYVSTRRISLEDAFGDSPLISLSGSSSLTNDEISELTAPTEAEQAATTPEQPVIPTPTEQTTATEPQGETLTAEQLQGGTTVMAEGGETNA